MSVRFLGIDTPEKRMPVPGANTEDDRLLDSVAGDRYLTNPFRPELGRFGIDAGLPPIRFGSRRSRSATSPAGRARDRAVIDLSRSDDVLLDPQHYFRIPNPGDRLFIPLHFVPLFVASGWRLE